MFNYWTGEPLQGQYKILSGEPYSVSIGEWASDRRKSSPCIVDEGSGRDLIRGPLEIP